MEHQERRTEKVQFANNDFKPTAHKVMIVLLALGILAIVAIGIYIGVVIVPKSVSPSESDEDATLLSLRELIGQQPKVEIKSFSNWDGTVKVNRVYHVAPSSASEISNVVLAARKLGLKIRAVGSGLSYSSLFPDEGQILMEMLSIVTREDGEEWILETDWQGRGFSVISVAAGVTLATLSEYLVTSGVQLPSVPVIKDATIGGVIGTASHGESGGNGTVSDFLMAVRLVDSQGQVQSYVDGEPEMEAIRACLGLCGIILEVTLKVDPIQVSFLTQKIDQTTTETLANASFLQMALQTRGFIGIWTALTSISESGWESYSRTGQLPETYDPLDDSTWTWLFTEVPADYPQDGELEKTTSDSEDADTQPPTATMSTSPVFTELLAQKATAAGVTTFVKSMAPASGTHPSLLIPFSGNDLPLTYDVCFAVRDTAQFTNGLTALQIAFDVLNAYTKMSPSKLPVNEVRMRWIAPSQNCLLCPGGTSGDYVLSMELVAPVGQELFEECANRIFAGLKADLPPETLYIRWAKFYPFLTDIGAFIHDSFGQDMTSFKAIRERLDPDNLFMNSLLESIFVPGST